MKNSNITKTDSYKFSHFLQLPPDMRSATAYIESRGGLYSEHNVIHGYQRWLLQHLSKKITEADIEVAEKIAKLNGEPFNREGWETILDIYGGKIPAVIRAVPEGTVMPAGLPIMTIYSVDDMWWVPQYIETQSVRANWYPITVASLVFDIKKVIQEYAIATTGERDPLIDLRLQNFGSRGVSSGESAEIGATAAATSFAGSDSVEAILPILNYYNPSKITLDDFIAGKVDHGFYILSIPAAEHFTITTWGKDKEAVAYENMLNQFLRPGSIVAVVSDSYDIYNAVRNIWGEQLRKKIQNSGGTVVIRPDSGIPHEVVCNILDILDEKFGHTTNQLGFKVLPDCVRVIQGDGINRGSIEEILWHMKRRGWASTNVFFGMGGALMQAPQRDDMKFAQKVCHANVNGEWRDVYKQPVTDTGKTSKKGPVETFQNVLTGEYVAKRVDELTDADTEFLKPVMRTVYNTGVVLAALDDFSTIKARIKSSFDAIFNNK
ncbi:MAG: nicotinate phosphoribosyltransferase [Candidatus Nitrosotenuis sp.]